MGNHREWWGSSTLDLDQNSSIHPTAFVHPTAVIYPGVSVGRFCRIGPGVVLGAPGFGYEENANGYWEDKKHTFGVVIEDYVDIGPNTCVDRGSWRDTWIGCGTKIDNLCHIAHNVWTGKNCVIIAHAGLGGSVTLFDGVWVGFGAHVNQRLTVSERAYIGTGSVVTKDVPAGVVVAGVPAKILRDREERDK